MDSNNFEKAAPRFSLDIDLIKSRGVLLQAEWEESGNPVPLEANASFPVIDRLTGETFEVVGTGTKENPLVALNPGEVPFKSFKAFIYEYFKGRKEEVYFLNGSDKRFKYRKMPNGTIVSEVLYHAPVYSENLTTEP